MSENFEIEDLDFLETIYHNDINLYVILHKRNDVVITLQTRQYVIRNVLEIREKKIVNVNIKY